MGGEVLVGRELLLGGELGRGKLTDSAAIAAPARRGRRGSRALDQSGPEQRSPPFDHPRVGVSRLFHPLRPSARAVHACAVLFDGDDGRVGKVRRRAASAVGRCVMPSPDASRCRARCVFVVAVVALLTIALSTGTALAAATTAAARVSPRRMGVNVSDLPANLAIGSSAGLGVAREQMIEGTNADPTVARLAAAHLHFYPMLGLSCPPGSRPVDQLHATPGPRDQSRLGLKDEDGVGIAAGIKRHRARQPDRRRRLVYAGSQRLSAKIPRHRQRRSPPSSIVIPAREIGLRLASDSIPRMHRPDKADHRRSRTHPETTTNHRRTAIRDRRAR